uniref:PIP49_C domain-containing protein n=1 Tax=Anopheles christyi TaxID=43041 RepID=A0A182JPL1_9DIPT
MQPYSTPYYDLLFVIIVLRYIPNENRIQKRPLEGVCDYDSHKLCPECFSGLLECDKFDEIFKLKSENLFNIINNILNSHTTRVGTLVEQNKLAVMKHLNRDHTIEKLLQTYCDYYSLQQQNCRWEQHDGSVNLAKEFIKKSILDSTRIEGCIFCPASDSRQALQRFLGLFDSTDNELWNLLTVRTNVEPLLLKLFAKYQDGSLLYVPKLLHKRGFTIIESYEGKALEHYYDYPLVTRMRIASELIKAAFKFTEGVHGFRVYLTDLNPDNVVVNLDGNHVQVSIVDLDNVILLDSWAEIFLTEQTHHVHSKIECHGCFAYVQDDVCRYQNSDLNLFAICQLLLENLNGNYAEGLLHKDQDTESLPLNDDVSQMLHSLLNECVYCQPPDCQNRSFILQDMLQIMEQTIIKS